MTEKHLDIISKNSFIYVIANVAGHFYILVTMPILTYYLSADEFGFYVILIQIVVFMQTLGLTLFSQALLRLYVEYEGDDQKIFVGTLFLSVFIFQSLLATGFYLGRHFIISSLYPNLTISPDPYVLYACLWAVILPLRSLSITFIKVQEQPSRVLLQNLVYGCLLIGSLLILLGSQERGLRGVFEALFLSEVGAQIIISRYMGRFIKISWSRKYFWRSIRFSTPLMASSFVFVLLSNIDRVILSRYVDLSELGMYGFGLMIGNIAAMVVSACVSSYTPRLLKIIKGQNDGNIGTLVTQIIRDNLAIVGFTVGIVYLTGDVLVALLGKGEIFKGAAMVVCGIASGHLVRSLYLFFQNGLFYRNRTREIFFLSITLLVMSIGSVHVLASIGGAKAVAFSNALIYLAVLPFGHLMVRKWFLIRLPVREVVRVALIFMVLVGCEFWIELAGHSFQDYQYWILKTIEVFLVLFGMGRPVFHLVMRGFISFRVCLPKGDGKANL